MPKDLHKAAENLNSVPVHKAREAASEFAALTVEEFESLWRRVARLEKVAHLEGAKD